MTGSGCSSLSDRVHAAGGAEGRLVAQVLLLPEALDGEEEGSPSSLRAVTLQEHALVIAAG